MYGPDNDQRLYFDLNLLSTLPIMTDDIEVGAVSDDDLVWNHGYDPWLELAKAIWDFVLQ
jgi:predicted transcriptional regulator